MSVGLLAGIVLIQTFPSFSLETVIEVVGHGNAPQKCCAWRKGSTLVNDPNPWVT